MSNLCLQSSGISKCTIRVLFFLFLSIALISGTAEATYIDLRISPEDVGVFTVNKQQQFAALGKIPTGAWVDITKEVDWYAEAYPLGDQTLKPEEVIQIDQDGLATLVSTWGRVKVSACYPKGCKIKPRPQPDWVAVISKLLLNGQEKPVVVDLQKGYLPAINFLLLKR